MAAAVCNIGFQVTDIQSVCLIVSAGDIADTNDLIASFGQKARSGAANIPHTLYGNAQRWRVDSQVFKGFHGHNADTAAGCFISSKGSADINGLSCDHARNRIAFEHTVGIHDPAHYLRVCVHIRRGNIAFRPDKR